MTIWTEEELNEIADAIEKEEPPFSVANVLKETRKHLIEAGLIQKRLRRRLTLTPFEVARFHAVKPKWCSGCRKIRMGTLFVAYTDGTCAWCHQEMNPDVERQVREDQKFYKRVLKMLPRNKPSSD